MGFLQFCGASNSAPLFQFSSAQATSREQTFHFFLALVPARVGLGTNRRISPGWSHQPGLKSPAQRLAPHAFAGGDFSSGGWLQPGTKGRPLVPDCRLEPPTRTKSRAALLFWLVGLTGTKCPHYISYPQLEHPVQLFALGCVFSCLGEQVLALGQLTLEKIFNPPSIVFFFLKVSNFIF